jgi:hypothetical protein
VFHTIHPRSLHSLGIVKKISDKIIVENMGPNSYQQTVVVAQQKVILPVWETKKTLGPNTKRLFSIVRLTL